MQPFARHARPHNDLFWSAANKGVVDITPLKCIDAQCSQGQRRSC
jgi:hypothetical protein